MSLIDAHVLLWDPEWFDYPRLSRDLAPLRRSFGPAELRPELERQHMDGAVVVQALPRTDETQHLLAMAVDEPIIRGVVGWVDLETADVADHVAMLRSGPGGAWLVGLRHPLAAEADADWLSRETVRRGLAAVAAAGLAFDLHLTTRELPAAYEACRDLPAVRFVVDHLAAPPIATGDLSAWGRALLPLAELPNVSAKISGLVTEADWRTWSIDDLRHPVELALDAFGAGRLMLGSDWPRCQLAGAYSDAIDSCRYLLAELPLHEQDDIRGGTASRVYRLDHHAG